MVKDQLGIKARDTLVEFVTRIDKRLSSYWDGEIEKNFGFNEEQRQLVRKILDHAKEHNLRTGKRIRASFVYYAYLLNKSEEEKIWNAAESVELVHTALLMHDDFMDQDKLRRGRPTTHVYFGGGDEHYGDAMAVNVGDAVLCLGYEKLLESGFEAEVVKPAMSQLLRGITNTAFGQAYDVSLPKIGEMSEDRVMALHKAKTAIYTYENPLFIGAILGKCDKEVLNILHKYSMAGGVAFQLQDDILGIFGEEEKTGKSADSDLLQGKVTLLVGKALEMGNDQQKEIIKKVWGNKGATEYEISEAKRVIKETGSYEYSVKTAVELAEKAAGFANELRSKNLNDKAIDYLEGIARYLVEREV